MNISVTESSQTQLNNILSDIIVATESCTFNDISKDAIKQYIGMVSLNKFRFSSFYNMFADDKSDEKVLTFLHFIHRNNGKQHWQISWKWCTRLWNSCRYQEILPKSWYLAGHLAETLTSRRNPSISPKSRRFFDISLRSGNPRLTSNGNPDIPPKSHKMFLHLVEIHTCRWKLAQILTSRINWIFEISLKSEHLIEILTSLRNSDISPKSYWNSF